MTPGGVVTLSPAGGAELPLGLVGEAVGGAGIIELLGAATGAIAGAAGKACSSD